MPHPTFQFAFLWLDCLSQILAAAGPFDRSAYRQNPSREEARRTLQVAPDACPEVIKAAYRALACKLHPDLGGSEQAMQRLNEAYATLMSAP
jgi:hypothetical protein